MQSWGAPSPGSQEQCLSLEESPAHPEAGGVHTPRPGPPPLWLGLKSGDLTRTSTAALLLGEGRQLWQLWRAERNFPFL